MDIDFGFYDNTQYFEDIVNGCENIVSMHHVDNGGTLRRKDLVAKSKYLLCAYFRGEIVGFVALKEDYLLKGDIYISQLAVSNEFLRKGIAKRLLGYVIENFNKYDYVTADVSRDNKASNNLFNSIGFKRYNNPRLKRSDSYVMDLRFNNKNKKFK